MISPESLLVHPGPVDQELQLRLYRRMLLIRRFEERILELFSQGLLHGTTHACIGQEAISAALFEHVGPDDIVFSNHRCHGHYLMHQQDPEGLLAELMGRQSGTCGGWGGSQHLHRGNFYSNGILGSTAAVATGMALSLRFLRQDGIAVAFLGDGAHGEGLVYESYNLATLWQLPILYVVENNHYSQSTPSRLQLAGTLPGRHRAFGLPVTEVSSNDAVVLWQTAREVVESVRAGRGPAALVINTFRLCSHSRSDDGRPESVIAPWREHEPVLIARRRLSQEDLARAEDEVEQQLASVEEKARAAPTPEPRLWPALPWPSPWKAEVTDDRMVRVLNQALHQVMAADERVVLLGEDILDPYGGAFKVTQGLSTAFPERVLTTPVSEGALTGMVAGLALRGMKPVLEIMFGDFLTLCLDQIINSICKFRGMYADRVRCAPVIRTPMGGRRGYGPTHSQTLERVCLGLPDLRVVAASLVHNVASLLGTAVLADEAAVLFIENKACYSRKMLRPDRDGWLEEFRLRQSSAPYPTVQLSPVDFRPAQCALVTYGGMVEMALEASRRLLVEHEVSCEVVVPCALSPMDWLPLQESLTRARGRLVTAEEGQIGGSWGSEVIAHCAEAGWLQRRPARVAAPAGVIPSARLLEDAHLPQVEDLIQAVLGVA